MSNAAPLATLIGKVNSPLALTVTLSAPFERTRSVPTRPMTVPPTVNVTSGTTGASGAPSTGPTGGGEVSSAGFVASTGGPASTPASSADGIDPSGSGDGLSRDVFVQIGRASCRERGETSV